MVVKHEASGLTVKYRRPMRGFMLLLTIVFASVGCGGGCGGAEAPATGSPTATEGEPTVVAVGDNAAPPVDPEPEAEPEDVPSVVVRGEVQSGGSVAIVIESRGSEATSLGGQILLERQVGDAFEAVDGVAGLSLRTSCEVAEAPACSTLVPGAELRPPPWLGTLGDAQCLCTRCGPAPAGVYRFVVQSCGGSERVEGEVFTLGDG